MELNYLREFLVLVQRKNYHAAAEELHISQPSLTNHIKALEKELGVVLLNRNTRNVELTRYGSVFLTYAETYDNLYQDCARNLSTKHYSEKIILTIAVEPHYYMGEVMDLLQQFQSDHRQYVIEFLNAPLVSASKLLRAGRCGMVFAPQQSLKDPEFETLNLRAERCVAVVKKRSSSRGKRFSASEGSGDAEADRAARAHCDLSPFYGKMPPERRKT